jgi:dolichyl-phosphate beta-glucosyltransferase
MNISIIIPAFNEELRLGKTLSLWQDFLEKELKDKVLEIIVVDDGSMDKTCKIAESFQKYLPIKIIKIAPNQGKGNAVKSGVELAEGDFIYIYDADGAVPPKEIKNLLLYTDSVDVIIGSRTAEGSYVKISLLRRFIGICFHLLCFPLIPGIKDASCGAKIFRHDAAKKIFELQDIKRFAFDIEILWLAKKLNLKIKEIGIEWHEIPGTKVRILKDGLEMFSSVLGIYKRQLFG